MKRLSYLPAAAAAVVLAAGISPALAHDDTPGTPPTPPPPAISQSTGMSEDGALESPKPEADGIGQMVTDDIDAMSAMLVDMRALQKEIDVVRPTSLSVVKDPRLVDVFTLESALELTLPRMQDALDTARSLSQRDDMFDLSDHMLTLTREMRSMMSAEQSVMTTVHGLLLELDPAARAQTAEHDSEHERPGHR